MSTFVSARYLPHDSPVVTSDTNLDKTTLGRRDSTSPEKTFSQSPAANMNDDLNPQAMPFQPGGRSNDFRPEHRSRNETYPPTMPPFAHPGTSWNAPFPGPPPPPPPPRYFTGNQYAYNGHDAYLHMQAQEQARTHYQWSQNYGHAGTHAQFQPYGQPNMYPPQHYQQQYQQQHFRQPHQPSYPPAAFRSSTQQANRPQAATNEELQTPTQPSKKSKKAKAKAKAAANGADTQQDIPQPAKATKKGRNGDAKIMLPAPQPADLYLEQAAQEPSASQSARHILVVLDLNGTVLYRPNKNAQSMIARPYLKPFLRYLFENFKVMVWSSARPVNVKALVDQALDKDLRAKLVATWARDTFGLSAANFSQNVQVYKNLKLIWSRDQIQQHHPEYATGERFGQHNTVLIDDSALKANAQPHNLLEIPEFEATPEQMEGDVLREVAGYLDALRHQSDVSKFINKHPFKDNGDWKYDWPAEPAGGPVSKTKKSASKSKRPSAIAPLVEVTNSLSTVTLEGTQQMA